MTAKEEVVPAVANNWTRWSDRLADAYARHAGSALGAIRFELVTRALLNHLPARPCRIVDLGGGFGRQAVLLARAGHEVVIVDPDDRMLTNAVDQLEREPADVRRRVSTVAGHAETASREVGGAFDLACCHSVLMYLDDPAPLFDELTRLVRPDGLVSILSLNGDAIGMRSGLQQNWQDALDSLAAGRQVGSRSLATRSDTVADTVRQLEARGFATVGWHGVRVFTDHLDYDCDLSPTDFATVCELEWIAGEREPYRSVARLFHLLAIRRSAATPSH